MQFGFAFDLSDTDLLKYRFVRSKIYTFGFVRYRYPQ